MKNLDNIPPEERNNFIQCDHCGEWVDCRDLGQVFEHEHKNLSKPIFSGSRKIGEPFINRINGEDIGLN